MPKSEKNRYRGVEYFLIELGDNKWKWSFYPERGAGPLQRGELAGTHLKAELACNNAIDAWLDGKKKRK
jgi:hypothetical protein